MTNQRNMYICERRVNYLSYTQFNTPETISITMVKAVVKRKAKAEKEEYKVHDPAFEKEMNTPNCKVNLKPVFLTNPDRLLGNAKHYFDVLRNNKLVNEENGILVLKTMSNINVKNKVNVKNQLLAFILEDCFLGALCQPEQITKIEQLIERVANKYKSNNGQNITTFAEDAIEITCENESELTLNIICSTYAQTYGELSSFAEDTSFENKPLQIELSYSFDGCRVLNLPKLESELQYCKVRFEAPKLLNYLKNGHGAHYYREIQNAKSNKKRKPQNSAVDKMIDEYLPTLSEEFPEPDFFENLEHPEDFSGDG